MKRIVLALVAVSAIACVSLPRPVSVVDRPTDALLLAGDWRGAFSSEDGRRGGSMTLALQVKNDTARGEAILTPVTYVAQTEATAPMRAEAGAALRSSMHFVSVTDGVVAGVVPPYFDTERLTVVQMTFVGKLRSWNVIEGTYVTLGANLRIEERGTWRVVRGEE
jgi:hypothetical protein